MKTGNPGRGKKTKQQRKTAAEFVEREIKAKTWVTDTQKMATALRRNERTFHGLKHEFEIIQSRMRESFENSKDVRHPRDVGDTREEILRKFLTETNLLPKRYAISTNSVRVASSTGHVSDELDIIIYDSLESISLMKRENTYEVLPVENVYCAIQVKSRLNRKEIKEAFKNIASFKFLDKNAHLASSITEIGETFSQRGFGLIFAYDTDLDWHELISEIKECSSGIDSYLWSNGIFILSKGHFFLGDQTGAKYHNQHVAAIKDLSVRGYPDRSNDVLFSFHSTLLELLRATGTAQVPIEKYYRIPLVAGKFSYDFAFGNFDEILKCDKHGPFAKKITVEKIEEILSWCEAAERKNAALVFAEAYGSMGEIFENSQEKAGDVVVYNPDDLPLTQILLNEIIFENQDGGESKQLTLAFDIVDILKEGLRVYLPHHYIATKELFEPCPKCKTWHNFQATNVQPSAD